MSLLVLNSTEQHWNVRPTLRTWLLRHQTTFDPAQVHQTLLVKPLAQELTKLLLRPCSRLAVLAAGGHWALVNQELAQQLRLTDCARLRCRYSGSAFWRRVLVEHRRLGARRVFFAAGHLCWDLPSLDFLGRCAETQHLRSGQARVVDLSVARVTRRDCGFLLAGQWPQLRRLRIGVGLDRLCAAVPEPTRTSGNHGSARGCALDSRLVLTLDSTHFPRLSLVWVDDSQYRLCFKFAKPSRLKIILASSERPTVQ